MDDIFTSSSSLLPRTITVAHDREYFSCEDAKLQFGNWVDKVISKLYNGKFGKNLFGKQCQIYGDFTCSCTKSKYKKVCPPPGS